MTPPSGSSFKDEQWMSSQTLSQLGQATVSGAVPLGDLERLKASFSFLRLYPSRFEQLMQLTSARGVTAL